MLFPCLLPICCIGIRRILQDRGIHSAIFFCAETSFPIFHNRLLAQAADKKLIFSDLFEVITAFFQKKVRILEKDPDPFVGVSTAAVVDDSVEIIGIIIMFHMTDHVIVPVLMKITDQFGNTGIDEFHTAQFPDVGLHHKGIHPADPLVDTHHPCSRFGKAGHTIMIQINSMGLFVVIASAAEPGKALVTERLFVKACGMECQLKAGIKHQVVDHFVIRVIKQHFDDLSSNDHIDRSIRSGILI